MKNRTCRICKQPILVYPSFALLVAQYGGTEEDYRRVLYTAHTVCVMAKRAGGDSTNYIEVRGLR